MSNQKQKNHEESTYGWGLPPYSERNVSIATPEKLWIAWVVATQDSLQLLPLLCSQQAILRGGPSEVKEEIHVSWRKMSVQRRCVMFPVCRDIVQYILKHNSKYLSLDPSVWTRVPHAVELIDVISFCRKPLSCVDDGSNGGGASRSELRGGCAVLRCVAWPYFS